MAAGTKACPSCGVNKPLKAYHKDPSKRDGRKSICGECFNARARGAASDSRVPTAAEVKRQRIVNTGKWAIACGCPIEWLAWEERFGDRSFVLRTLRAANLEGAILVAKAERGGASAA